MRLTALLPTFALCLAPFASAQSSDQDLRAAIRKIVREEIQAALKDMHQPGMHQPVVVSGTVKGQPMMVVQDLPKDSFQWTTKAPKGKAGQKGEGAEGKGMIAVRLDDTEGHAETLGFGVNTVEGKPIKLELNKLIEGKLLAGKLLEGKALEGSTGNVRWRVVRDEDGEGEHKHEGGAHEVKGMTFHAGPGTMVLRTEGGEGQEGQSAMIRLLKAHATTATEAAKAAAECCEAAKEATECCEVAKQAESCCEAPKEATKAAECCEGEKCAECVIEVAPVAKKAEKAEKKAKKAGKKKAKKSKPVETEEIELKIG